MLDFILENPRFLPLMAGALVGLALILASYGYR